MISKFVANRYKKLKNVSLENSLALFSFVLIIFLAYEFDHLYDFFKTSHEIVPRNVMLKASVSFYGSLLSLVGVFLVSFRYRKNSDLMAKIINLYIPNTLISITGMVLSSILYLPLRSLLSIDPDVNYLVFELVKVSIFLVLYRNELQILFTEENVK